MWKEDLVEISYKTKKVKRLCEDYSHAKRILAQQEVNKLYKCIQFIAAASCLLDVKNHPPYSNLEKLKGDRENTYSLAFNSKRSSYRLILIPLDERDNEMTDDNIHRLYKNTMKIKILEVSKHYE